MPVTRNDVRIRRRLGQSALMGMVLGGLLSVVPPGIALLAPPPSAGARTTETFEPVDDAAFDISVLLAEVEWQFEGLPFAIESEELAEEQLAAVLDSERLLQEFSQTPETVEAAGDAWAALARTRLEPLASADGFNVLGADDPQLRLRVVLHEEEAMTGARVALNCGPDVWRVFTATQTSASPVTEPSPHAMSILADSRRLCAGHHPKHGLVAECVRCPTNWRQLLNSCRDDGWEVVEPKHYQEGLPALCRRGDRVVGILNYSSPESADLYLLIVEIPAPSVANDDA